MKPITAFQASDGTLFESQEACATYEADMAEMMRIKEFLNSDYNPYPRGAFRNASSRIVSSWEAFKADTGK